MPNQRESQSCFIVMWSGRASLLNRICTYAQGGRVRGGTPHDPHQRPVIPPPSPHPTHMLQRQLQAVAQDPPQVPDLCPHGASHVLLLQGAEQVRGLRVPPALWDQRRRAARPQLPSAHPTWDPTHQAEPGARAVGPGLGRARGLGAR